mmetsp:Transcript_4144/g.7029  ORF Transcript_4144/g.7029 Transcript_4144/m.7029 type:complete len:319 (+) Transcript_4144:84-1040(+)
MSASVCPIGTPGEKWGPDEFAAWKNLHSVKRSYHDEVVAKINALGGKGYTIECYGSLSHDSERYPLYAVSTVSGDNSNKKTVLITGGIHGYETSGVQGALRFLETKAEHYRDHFDFIVAPCVSPWGYETINRWNFDAVDPNRSFKGDGLIEESRHLLKHLQNHFTNIIAHFDLHETTDTDNTTFRPALAARDGVFQTNFAIPDGFYLVGDSLRPQKEFQAAVIRGVSEVTHIAPPDNTGPNPTLNGVPIEQEGVFFAPAGELGLCMGLSSQVPGVKFVTTTEVYPDSDRATDEMCTLAQVAAVSSGLDYIIREERNQL